MIVRLVTPLTGGQGYLREELGSDDPCCWLPMGLKRSCLCSPAVMMRLWRACPPHPLPPDCCRRSPTLGQPQHRAAAVCRDRCRRDPAWHHLLQQPSAQCLLLPLLRLFSLRMSLLALLVSSWISKAVSAATTAGRLSGRFEGTAPGAPT